MPSAHLLADIGPCDDNGYLLINGLSAVSVPLNETRRFQRTLQDGSHNFVFRVTNDGRFAWKARLRLIINRVTYVDEEQAGDSFLFAGEVYNREWQCQIVNGEVSEFLAVQPA
ncbi:hypothetical protein [Actinomycetospora flava]|uniref:Uncharacterized protein n=1 Tax=Actinomycetospora flava TaxID=3129232 RepID=A0ABU8M605_9PSEU